MSRDKELDSSEHPFYLTKKITNFTGNWQGYDARAEFERQGACTDSVWRATPCNANYELSPTYPRVLVVPYAVSDDDLGAIRGKYSCPNLNGCEQFLLVPCAERAKKERSQIEIPS